MWMECFLLATHQLILIPILGLIYLLTTCSLVANIRLSKHSSRVTMISLLPVKSEPFRSQIVNIKHVWYFWSLRHPRQMPLRETADRAASGTACWRLEKWHSWQKKAKRMSHACIVLSNRNSTTSSFLFFQCKTRLMAWVRVWSGVCGNKRQACGFVFWMNNPLVSAFRWLYR